MRERSPHTPARPGSITVQPSVGAHGSCWRRQAKNVVSRDPQPSTAADPSGDGPTTIEDPCTPEAPCGDGRSPHPAKN